MILPHINYCLLSWGSKPDKIFQLQKKAVRAISGANSKSHTEPLFKFYIILKADDIFMYKLLTFYWNAKQAQLPKYLSKFYQNCLKAQTNTQLDIREINLQFISMSILKEHVDTS